MSKITNWTREIAENDYMRWHHDFYATDVEAAKNDDGSWTVTVPLEVSASEDVHRPTFSEPFSNKSDALEFAREFMKEFTYSRPDHQLDERGELFA